MKFVFAPSDLELIKDMLYLKTRYKIPPNAFKVIPGSSFNPFCQTIAGELKNFSPIVYDGKNYDILLRRGKRLRRPG